MPPEYHYILMRMLSLFGGLGLLALLYYGGMPLLILSSMGSNAGAEIGPLRWESCPPDATDYLVQMTQSFSQLGFELVGYFAIGNVNPNQVTYLAWFYHRQTVDKAMATVIVNENPTMRKIARYVEFTTTCADERSVNTNNTEEATVFKPNPQSRSWRLPGIWDLNYLYYIHKQNFLEFAPNGVKVLPEPGTELTYIREKVLLKSFDQQVKFGILRFDATTNRYRPTLYGAYYMTWRLLWPMKDIRLASRRRQTQELIRRFSQTPQQMGGTHPH